MKIPLSAMALAAALVMVPAPAYAYLDPGAGSVLLQGLMAAAAAVTAVISINLRRVKAIFRKLIRKHGRD